jgi:hypothetical protein
MSDLAPWDSFYVIVGSAAGALIGLQFVVITLIAQRPPARAAEAGAAFATPTIVHFSVVLFLAALIRAPWDTASALAIVCGAGGLGGIVYALLTARRMYTQTTYKPDLEDWSFHVVLPLAAYVILSASAFVSLSHAKEALFGIAGAALLLLFVGIHNAWDAVSYHSLSNLRNADREKRGS